MNSNFYNAPLSPEEARQRLAMQQQQQQQQQNRQQAQAQAQAHVQSQAQSQAQQGQRRGQAAVAMINTANLSGLDHPGPLSASIGDMQLPRGDSLDDIVSQNSREFQRRRSVPHPFADPLSPTQATGRRMSAMDFSPAGDAFPGFSFGYPAGAGMPGTSGPFPQQGLMAMPGQAGYDTVGMDPFPNLNLGSMGANPGSMGLFSSPDLQSPYPTTTLDAVSPDYAMDMGVENAPMNAPSVAPIARFALGGSGDVMGTREDFDRTPVPQEHPGLMRRTSVDHFGSGMPPPEPREPSLPASFQSPPSTTTGRNMSQSTAAGRSSIATAASTAPTTAAPAPPPGHPVQEFKKDVYSKSGFDMLRALFYVATRKNPTVEIGAVDLSCAFVVCDLTLNDCPIIYVSDNFQNLTGYNRHEIVGQNCRFLQSPDGKVEAGSRREFVANDAVFKLKNAVAEPREIQQSLINYRKGGKPFLNLLTMIPIPWDSDEFRYCIGFQIDLVECPDAISGQESHSGAMQVNYRHSDIGQYFWSPPGSTHWEPESGQTLSVDEVSSLIQQHNPRAAPSEWHKQSWDKMLLENADDVVHVLSLKGLFLYLSPACKKILEYDPADLVGTSLSSICHPSDIVPVTRELKDAQQNTTVNIAFRIRRKQAGYVWFESHGTLFAEPNRGGRKYIILVGRKRPVFSLRRRDLDAFGGSGAGSDSEIWSKVSTAGMFLHVSSSAKALLDLWPRELEGTGLQELMRKESRAEFGRTIEKARRGAVVGLRHEVVHKRGQLIPAQTVFYPGDVGEGGGKPSFLIALTKVGKGVGGRVIAGAKGVATTAGGGGVGGEDVAMSGVVMSNQQQQQQQPAPPVVAAAPSLPVGDDEDPGSDDDIFAELRTTRCTSWQYELRQMEKVNRLLAEELTQLMANKKKRKRRKGGAGGLGGAGSGGGAVRDCANCHKRDTPEWRRGPSGNRDLCNSCGLWWAKQTGKVSPRNSRSNSTGEGSVGSKRGSVSTASTNSPVEASPLRWELSADSVRAGSAGSGADGNGNGRGGSMEMGSITEE